MVVVIGKFSIHRSEPPVKMELSRFNPKSYVVHSISVSSNTLLNQHHWIPIKITVQLFHIYSSHTLCKTVSEWCDHKPPTPQYPGAVPSSDSPRCLYAWSLRGIRDECPLINPKTQDQVQRFKRTINICIVPVMWCFIWYSHSKAFQWNLTTFTCLTIWHCWQARF